MLQEKLSIERKELLALIAAAEKVGLKEAASYASRNVPSFWSNHLGKERNVLF